MLTTIVRALFFSVFLLGATAFWALFLQMGLRRAKVQAVTLRRIATATCLAFLLWALLAVSFCFFYRLDARQAIFLGFAGVVEAALIQCAAIAWIFRTGYLRAVRACLLPSIPAVGISCGTLLVVMSFVVEMFTTPTNSMAPTLLGKHWRGTCEQCGLTAYCPPSRSWHAGPPHYPPMICGECFHVGPSNGGEDRVFSSDRFVVAKFLKPQRWELLVFRFPGDPSQLYVQRLVGLPGEEIVIEGGDVFADGKKLTVPKSIRGIEYLSEMPGLHTETWGTRDWPATLGPDEYFVLGDFSALALDSRLWRKGAPGHSPYAVPESHVVGVVTHIYWPPERWRKFR